MFHEWKIQDAQLLANEFNWDANGTGFKGIEIRRQIREEKWAAKFWYKKGNGNDWYTEDLFGFFIEVRKRNPNWKVVPPKVKSAIGSYCSCLEHVIMNRLKMEKSRISIRRHKALLKKIKKVLKR